MWQFLLIMGLSGFLGCGDKEAVEKRRAEHAAEEAAKARAEDAARAATRGFVDSLRSLGNAPAKDDPV